MSSPVRVKAEPNGKANGRAKNGARAAADDEGSARKRARKDAPPAQEDDEATPEVEDEAQQNEQEDDEDEDEDPDERPALIRDAKGYVAGSIVRVAAENFVTYDKVEFTPGPYLNMVLGPNGTGKSTIACAIALGLGFPPKVLGRSVKLSDYVKTGTQECWIEIELKGLPGKPNAIIRRFLNKDNDQTRFHLNGASASAKEISTKMEELHVQVGNLCTFLPQDRVSSFSALSAAELLKETQKAAGDTRLSGWHQTLISERESQAQHEASLAENQEQLKRREDKHVEQEREVKLYDQRKKYEFELAILSLLIPVAEYNAASQQFLDSKAHKEEIGEQLAALIEANKPFEESRTALDRRVNDLEQGKKIFTSRAIKATKEVKERTTGLAKCEADVAKTRDELASLKKADKDRRVYISTLTTSVEKMENALGEEPEAPDYTEMNAQGAVLLAERQKVVTETSELENESEKHRRDISAIEADMKRISVEGKALTDVNNQKFNEAKKWEKDMCEAVLWMREQKRQGNFKGNVYEPARLSISLKDNAKQYAALAEGPISIAHFKTFVFEEQADYDFMMRTINDKPYNGRQLRINGAQLKQGRFARRDFPDVYSADQMQRWGFDCLAIDLIEGPEAVLAYLCENAFLHKTPISFGHKPLAHKDIENSGLVARYYAPDGSHSINRSKYGARGSLVESRQLNPAKILAAGADTARIEELKGMLNALVPKKAELATQHDETVRLHTIARDKVRAIDAERNALKEKRERMKDPLIKWQAARTKLQSKRTTLQKEMAKPTGEKRSKELKESMRKLTDRRVRLSLEHKDHLMAVAKAQIGSIDIHLRHIQAQSDLRAMRNSADEKDQELAEKRAEWEAIDVETTRLRKIAKETRDHSLECLNAADEAQNAEAKRRREEADPDLEELNKKKLEVESELNVMQTVSPAVLARYEARKLEIVDFKEKVANDQEKLDRSTTILKKVEKKWLPKLERLVSDVSSKFSAAFKSLGCLGEIRIAKDTDYNKWGIEILVSFRDKEALQVLTSHRQSGGERALTTVMYLMSLASLAKAPFALVDEINQGMDQRVERNVHNALVETTCQGDVGQYFLITPKLLPNLNYHAKMKVLVIQNGEWLPESLSLEDVVAKRLRAKRAARA
ncbi:hypothetical protein RQP46_002025 [Phenoliferia psychrophenolica]